MMRFEIASLILLVSSFFVSGCLQTRSDVKTGEQRQVLQQQLGTIQKTNADTSNQIVDLEEQNRFLNGRVEVLENRASTTSADFDQLRRNFVETSQSQNQKIAIFQEALTKMEQNVNILQTELAALRAQNLAGEARRETQKELKKASDKNPFESGENYFDKKDYKAAILEYEKYRNKYPKGKNFASATYKMGVSFQELGMKEEAKTFYDEVVTKHSKSDEARKAKSRLQKIK
jgi:TolA-binding protein